MTIPEPVPPADDGAAVVEGGPLSEQGAPPPLMDPKIDDKEAATDGGAVPQDPAPREEKKEVRQSVMDKITSLFQPASNHNSRHEQDEGASVAGSAPSHIVFHLAGEPENALEFIKDDEKKEEHLIDFQIYDEPVPPSEEPIGEEKMPPVDKADDDHDDKALPPQSEAEAPNGGGDDNDNDEEKGDNGDKGDEDKLEETPSEEEMPITGSPHKDRGMLPPEIDFLKDKPSDMTLGRRLALALMNQSWYNPRADMHIDDYETENQADLYADTPENQDNSTLLSEAYPYTRARHLKPNLRKAWAYFEHVGLSRHSVNASEEELKHHLDRAEPGEKYLETKLYSPIFTPEKQLGDWGIGVGLYFSTLRAIAILTFIAGGVNIANLLYYQSEDYSPSGQEDVRSILRGTVLCPDTVWVPCVDCPENFDFGEDRLGHGMNLQTGENVTFAVHNECSEVANIQGIVCLITLVVLCVGFALLNGYLSRAEISFDEDEQTAQDYSILVENPPGDARDPKEWKTYFENSFGVHVTAMTVAINNDLLVQSLVERREVLQKISIKIEPGTPMDLLTLADLAAKESRSRNVIQRLMAKLSPGIPEFFARLVVLNANIRGLGQQDYPANKLFVTFETEAGQRKVLSSLCKGSCEDLPEQYLFRKEVELRVREPAEPDAVRWQDLSETLHRRIIQHCASAACTILLIVFIAFITNRVNDVSVAYASTFITIANTAFPMFAKALTSLEAHPNEGSKQRSLYVKIALFRWVNTAIVITIITPFTFIAKVDGGLIDQVYTLFFAEIVTTTVLQLLDIGGHIARHYSAPRAASQEAMNDLMKGSPFELAERYTNMTKIFFLALWYYSIFPLTLFFCSLALFINYYVDKFSLMRTWKRPPRLGPRMSQFSRRYFFPLALASVGFMTAYFMSGFPFDNLCTTDDEVNIHEGMWVVEPKGDADFMGDTFPMIVNVSSTDPTYNFCLQDFLRYHRSETRYPFISRNQREGDEWMTPRQETWSDIWGWTSVGILAIIILTIVLTSLYKMTIGFFRSTYQPRGEDQGINYSDVPSISSYIPQVESHIFPYPLLACNADELNEDLVSWTDPERPYSFYDLTNDADVLLRNTNASSQAVFSRIYYYGPPKTKVTKVE